MVSVFATEAQNVKPLSDNAPDTSVQVRESTMQHAFVVAELYSLSQVPCATFTL